jgi:hypothetical protein
VTEAKPSPAEWYSGDCILGDAAGPADGLAPEPGSLSGVTAHSVLCLMAAVPVDLNGRDAERIADVLKDNAGMFGELTAPEVASAAEKLGEIIDKLLYRREVSAAVPRGDERMH